MVGFLAELIKGEPKNETQIRILSTLTSHNATSKNSSQEGRALYIAALVGNLLQLRVRFLESEV